MRKARILIGFLVLLLLSPVNTTYAKGKTVLSTAKLTITQGKSKMLKVKNTKKRVKWSIVSGKKYLTLCNKSKKSVKVVGKRPGTAIVQGKIGSKKYICKVIIKRKQVTQVNVIVNGQTFQAELSNTKAAKALAKKLPMTINMKELNGNEKYYYLKSDLPAEENISGNIHLGDIMLYGSDCLVFFYKNFRTSYQYTRIGKFSNPQDFAAAVGTGNITVTIEAR